MGDLVGSGVLLGVFTGNLLGPRAAKKEKILEEDLELSVYF